MPMPVKRTGNGSRVGSNHGWIKDNKTMSALKKVEALSKEQLKVMVEVNGSNNVQEISNLLVQRYRSNLVLSPSNALY